MTSGVVEREEGPVTTAATGPEAMLRELCGRIVGYDRTQAIEHALRSIHLCINHSAALVLLGDAEADLLSIARALHDRTLGADRPFVICGRRSRNASHEAATASRFARGGSLCVLRRRLPDDFPSVVPLLRDPAAAVQLIVCADASFDSHPLATLPVPIVVPSIQERASELGQIIDAYAVDAVRTLGDAWFLDEDRSWILKHAAGSLSEIEKATLRLVALRQAGSIYQAAARLGMSHVALGQWIGRRRRSRGSSL